MEWSLFFWGNSILLGTGLAMDAFSVSLANGLNEPRMEACRMGLIAGTFAAFQALMPMTGWGFVHTILEHFQFFQRILPWLALALLVYIGVGMVREGMQHAAALGPKGRWPSVCSWRRAALRPSTRCRWGLPSRSTGRAWRWHVL